MGDNAVALTLTCSQRKRQLRHARRQNV